MGKWHREGKKAGKSVLLCKLLVWQCGLDSTWKLRNRLGHFSELSYPRIIGLWLLMGTLTHHFWTALGICRLKESSQTERCMCLLQDATEIGIWAGH